MKTSEMVFNYLKGQGLMPEVMDNGNIYFKYQMRNFLYIENDDDKDFFQMFMPGIYDVTEDNREAVLEAANKVNCNYKIAKCMVFDDSVWIATDCMLDSTPVLDDIVPRLLNILLGAQNSFYEQIN